MERLPAGSRQDLEPGTIEKQAKNPKIIRRESTRGFLGEAILKTLNDSKAEKKSNQKGRVLKEKMMIGPDEAIKDNDFEKISYSKMTSGVLNKSGSQYMSQKLGSQTTLQKSPTLSDLKQASVSSSGSPFSVNLGSR